MADRGYDVVIIGGGPGGYPAAIRAAQLGKKVALVEREHLGGICLNWGCIPTKALLRSAEIHHTVQRLGEFGLSADNLRFDLGKLVERSRRVARRLSAGVKHLLRKNGVEVIAGHGRLDGPGRVAVEAEAERRELAAPHVILATGARAAALPDLAPDGDFVWTYKQALVPEALPKSLLVVGAGAIGIEFASFYREFGAEVTVVEMLPQILPAEDAEIAAIAREQLERRGIGIRTGASLATLDRQGAAGTATLDLGGGETESIPVDRVILAVGIVGNLEKLGLEGTRIQVEDSHIAVNEWCETAEARIYAIGDVAGPPWLAHKATHEGVLCAERIAGVEGLRPLDPDLIPACSYCRPQIASVGLSEARALERGHELRVGRFPFAGNGKAIALGEPEGMVKTVFDAETGELLGAHMVGAEVTELIQGFVIAKTLETTEAELMHTVFAHPTLSETLHESVLEAYGRPIHV